VFAIINIYRYKENTCGFSRRMNPTIHFAVYRLSLRRIFSPSIPVFYKKYDYKRL